MKLHEIVKIPQQTFPVFNLGDFELTSAQQFGKAENIPIFRLQLKTDHALKMYALKVNDEIVSYVVGRYGTLDGLAFFIEGTWTIPSERNKGLTTSLYQALYVKYHIRLVGDLNQSPETRKIWKKLSSVLPVKVLDTNNKEIKSLTDFSDEELYDKNRGLRLMLEEVIPDPTFITIPAQSPDDVRRDHIHYTHEENVGKYI